jgi:hypothetical protein
MSRCAARSTALPHEVDAEPSALTPSDPAKGSTSKRVSPGRRSPPAVAWLLLNAVLVAGLCACLPPDFEIDTAKNQPVQIDKSLLTINPDRFIDVSNCQNLTFDVSTAVSDPDGDEIQTVWLVNYEQGLGSPPDAVGFLRYTFRPCENPKLVAGVPLTLELFVLDRRPLSFDDADEAKTLVDPETTTDNVVWFIGADDLSCCQGGGL